MVNTRSALTRLGTRARGRDGDQRWLPLRLSALHSRGRPDKRNSVPLPGLPKFTGSAFAVLVRMTKEALTIEGTYKTFSSIGGSGNPILRHFCPECGSSIAEEPGTRPGIIILNVGTLDDPTVAKAGREIFRDDAKLYMSCTASRRKPPRSAASHNLLKTCPSLARWSGSRGARRRRRKAEPSGGIVQEFRRYPCNARNAAEIHGFCAAVPEDAMGRAARTWQLRRCNLTDGVSRCPSRTT